MARVVLSVDRRYWCVLKKDGTLLPAHGGGGPKMYVHLGTAEYWAKHVKGTVVEVVVDA